ncbi:MAG: multidrug efflux RND transporter permease subunit [Planctomycetes bacterium]|nr:multidrug efflux RND transporter permease subunit [Planctomycetota bacterium]
MMSRFFIDRPIFAWVLSIVMVMTGGIAVFTLPIAQYPPIVPPTIQVTTSFPGASATTIADAVGQPIEAQVNGTEGMIYMSSTCTNNGMYTLTVSFKVGTDIHTALMLVQTRVQLAMPQLPTSVQAQGVNVKIQSPNILLTVNLLSPDGRHDPLFMSNYAQINIFDDLSRLPGVGLVNFLGQRQYSIRAWIDPQKVAARDMTVSEVIKAIQNQNVVVAPGNVGQQPVPKGQDYQLVLNTLGRLTTTEQFGEIVVKSGNDGRLVYLRDVARLELGSQNSDLNCNVGQMVNGKPTRFPSLALAIFQLPSANALDTADGVKAKMEQLKKKFPAGLEYEVVYDTTPFIKHSVDDVFHTIFIAALLVIVVVLVFIQDWHAMLLPIMDITVALIGTFVVMTALGFSLNNLSLFGLVLAVGIVVDDSIVVVENIERWMESGLPAREATIKAMDEITGPVIGITLVLVSVFVPTAFIPGLSGEFFRQFALTIAASAVISASNALTLAPARAAAWIKPHGHGPNAAPREAMPRVAYVVLFGALTYFLLSKFAGPALVKALHAPAGGYAATWAPRVIFFLPGAIAGWFIGPAVNRGLNWFFGLFNKAFDATTNGYVRIVRGMIRVGFVVMIGYVGLLALTGYGFATSPTGFIPEQDQGYVLVNVELPDAASVQRTDEILNQLNEIALKTPGVKKTMAVAGYSAFFQCDSSNWGTVFVILDEFENRTTRETQAAAIINKLNREYYGKVLGCRAAVFGAPPVPGLGQGGGFQLQLVDHGGLGPQALAEVTETIVQKANAQPGLDRVFTTFRASTPQLYLDIDRENAAAMGVSLSDVFDTLNANMGSVYINQFNRFGRIWQVNIQAEGEFRKNVDNLKLLQVRNRQGQMVPLGALVTVRNDNGPTFLMRYNNLSSAAINGGNKPGFSSGQAISLMEQLSDQNLPTGMGYEWTNISYQEVTAGNTGIYVFALAVALVFLILAALYESWGLPLAIILVVPMCLLSSIIGLVWIARMPIDIFSQIGFVVLVAMAAKNAILIVEYATQKRKEGMERQAAILEASKLRLRPILMTSFAFIFGVYPLMVATGAGWEMRRSLGTAVTSGMIGVTLFGIFLTPVFYSVVTRLTEGKNPPPTPAPAEPTPHDALHEPTPPPHE